MAYKQSRFAGILIFLALLMGAPILLWIAASLSLLGSVVIHDTDNSVTGVMLRDSDQVIAIRRWPGGIYASSAKLEGEAVAICANGTHLNFGYITSGVHIWRAIDVGDCVMTRKPALE